MATGSREYYVVDAFATERFSGNPAAVLLNADGLTDDQMKAIAAEFNLSETAFVLPPVDSPPDLPGRHRIRLRWFTPTVEVAMCGHATVATLHALFEAGRLGQMGAGGNAEVAIETVSGVLSGFVEEMPGGTTGQMIWLELPPPSWSPGVQQAEQVRESLGLVEDDFDTSLPPVVTNDKDIILFISGVLKLNELTPDYVALQQRCQECGIRGVSVATTGTITPSIHVQSRFFAPAAGVDEDPVTGSVHGPLAAYLAAQGHVPSLDGTTVVTCIQAKAGGRGGLLHALVRCDDGSHSVRIGGQAITTMRGELLV